MQSPFSKPSSEPASTEIARPAESESAANSSQPRYGRILLAGAILGLLANFLFYGRLPGVSTLLFVLAGLTALFLTGHSAGIPLTWQGAWPAIPLIFLSAMVALRAAPFLSFLNIATCLVLLIALAHTYPGRRVLRLGFLDYIVNGISSLIEICLMRPFQALERAWGESRAAGRPPRRAAAILRGLLLALPILIIFTALFSAADAVFEHMVNDTFAWLDLENLPELVARLVFSLVVAWLVVGGLAYAIRSLTEREMAEPGERSGRLGVVEAVVVLGSVDILFALFVAVQFRYFFGGQANISLVGYTYSEYARRGFAELVVVAVLTLGLIFAIQSLTVRRTRQQATGFESLAAILVALTGVILFSAFQRMRLYEEAYGFTQLRFLVYVFITWLAVLLLVSLLTLHYDRSRWFATAVFVAALGYVATLDILDMDAFIARQNLDAFLSRQSFTTIYSGTNGQSVDAIYLATLSDDAVPALLGAYAHLPQEEMEVLGGALHQRLNELNDTAATDGWPQPGGAGWNYARWRAWVLLRAAAPGLENFEPQRYYWEFPLD